LSAILSNWAHATPRGRERFPWCRVPRGNARPAPADHDRAQLSTHWLQLPPQIAIAHANATSFFRPRRIMTRLGLRPGGGNPSIGARAQFFGSAVLFGLMAALTRITTQQGFSAGQIAVVRFAAGVALTLAWFIARPGTFAPVKHRLLLTRGALGGLAAFLYFVALARIPAGEATLLNNTFPILATALAYFGLRERPTVHLALGLGLASVGVFLVLRGNAVRFAVGWGELAAMASALLAAGAVTAIRALRATDNAPTIFFAFCLGGLMVSWPFAIGPWPSGSGPWTLALIGVGGTSFGAQLLMTQAYGGLTVPEAAIWQQLTPVMTYLWAIGLLDEHLAPIAMVGVLLGITGVAYGSVAGRTSASDGSLRSP
jgi:drug/metabolite transporter (DMT)-like permease